MTHFPTPKKGRHPSQTPFFARRRDVVPLFLWIKSCVSVEKPIYFPVSGFLLRSAIAALYSSSVASLALATGGILPSGAVGKQ